MCKDMEAESAHFMCGPWGSSLDTHRNLGRKGRKYGIGLSYKDKGSGFYSLGNGDPVKFSDLGSDLSKWYWSYINLNVLFKTVERE